VEGARGEVYWVISFLGLGWVGLDDLLVFLFVGSCGSVSMITYGFVFISICLGKAGFV
jgi:hypothetical protein